MSNVDHQLRFGVRLKLNSEQKPALREQDSALRQDCTFLVLARHEAVNNILGFSHRFETCQPRVGSPGGMDRWDMNPDGKKSQIQPTQGFFCYRYRA